MAKFEKLKTGELLSETTFSKVVKIAGDRVQLETEAGEPIVLDKKYVDTILSSGVQYDKEEKITRTELAALYIKNANVALQVNFNKQVKETDVLKEIVNAHENSSPKEVEKEFKKAIHKALEGEERVLNGYHYGHQDEFGRIKTIDLDIPKGQVRERLVDPRKINYLIVKGIKYIAKS